ncbi:hypothetical protein HK104_007220, partial [Borealophlyctis nickersoniae]
MPKEHQIISPVNGKVYKTIPLATDEDARNTVERARGAFEKWRQVPLAERVRIVTAFVDAFVKKKDPICEELTMLMGRPIRYNPNEVRGFEQRARHLVSIAKDALADHHVERLEGFDRFIRREPLGVVFVIAAWNYPYLIAVNAVVPALLAGNVVILKQAPQTFPCADRFADAFKEAGLPEGVFQVLHVDHATAETVIKNPHVDHVMFTGSVRGGQEVQRIASSRFIGVGLELGGKDPAYVREDADVGYAAENLVDGAMYNSGQSCCGIERIYVHEKLYDDFVRKAVDLVKQYKLGDPTSPDTTLGPVVRTEAAETIREHIQEAVSKGAKALIDEDQFSAAKVAPYKGTPYVAPQILVDVTHNMRVMKEETFGPVVGIMKVRSDDEAIELMNDSDFGLTASVWTKDPEAAMKIGDRVNTGTFFMNRCDYLDPALAWTGVKNSGRGCTLSKDWNRGKRVVQFNPRIGSVDALCVDFDEGRLYAGSLARGVIAICNPSTGKVEKNSIYCTEDLAPIEIGAILMDKIAVGYLSGDVAIITNFRDKNSVLKRFVGFHTGPVTALAWSPNLVGVLVSGGADGLVKVWDVATNRCVRNLTGAGEPISRVALDNKKHVLAVTTAGKLVVWDFDISSVISQTIASIQHPQQHDPIATAPSRVLVNQSPSEIESLYYEGTASMAIVVGKTSSEAGLRCWQVAVGMPICTFASSHAVDITASAWDASTFGISERPVSILVTGDEVGTVCVWEIPAGAPGTGSPPPVRPVRVIDAHHSMIAQLSVDPFKFVSAAVDGSLKAFDVTSGKCIRTLALRHSRGGNHSVNQPGGGFIDER